MDEDAQNEFLPLSEQEAGRWAIGIKRASAVPMSNDVLDPEGEHVSEHGNDKVFAVRGSTD